jgi:hypothetical protein
MTANSNIFNIPNADQRTCKIVSYTDGHKMLTVEVLPETQDDVPLLVHFGRVVYHSGPIYWQGANFRIASLEEYEQFLRDTLVDWRLIQDHKLFTAQTQGKGLCRIFALFGQLSNCPAVGFQTND